MCSMEKRGNVFLLTLTGDHADVDEHRLNSTLIVSIRTALSDAKFHSTRGSVFITIAQGKFFCNGFDINISNSNSNNNNNTVHQLNELFKRLVLDFISLPMPTIAVVTGHAVGAGLGLALCHDYVFMRRDHGIMCLNEIDIGVLLPDYGFELLRSKVKPEFLRDIMLRGVKVKADQAVTMGLVDVAYEDRETAIEGGLRMGVELGKKKWDGELYAEIRKNLYPTLCGMLGLGFKPRM